MKRIIISTVAVIMLCMTLVFNAGAADNVTVNVTASKSSVKVGEEVTFTVKISGSYQITSGLVQYSFSDKFEFVKGEWTAAGSAAMKNFDGGNKTGVIAYAPAQTVTGNYCKITLKAKTVVKTAEAVKISVTLKNGSTEVGTGSKTTNVSIICANHTYGSYTKTDGSYHSRTCSTCGYADKVAHKWNSGTVTSPASCKNTGTKLVTCTVCQATKNVTIDKTDDHKYGAWSKKDGTYHQHTCSVCQKVAKEKHKWDNGTVTKPATLTEEGEKTFKCKSCDASKVTKIDKLSENTTTGTTTLPDTTTPPETTLPDTTTVPDTTTPDTTTSSDTTPDTTTVPDTTLPPDTTDRLETTDTTPFSDNKNTLNMIVLIIAAAEGLVIVALVGVIIKLKKR